MKKYFKTTAATLILFTSLCSFESLISSFAPPQGYTGADGANCTQCHSTNPINNNGGSVTVNGLPDSYTPGQSYNFSLTTAHSLANRVRWGFSIEARNSFGMAVGSFSTINGNAAINGSELSHRSAVSTGMQMSYTYENLTWTAPSSPTGDDEEITFYFVGNAANGSGTGGDFIYSGTKMISILKSVTYTFTGNGNWSDAANWSNNTKPPSTITGVSTIVIDPLPGNECVLDVEQHIGAGATFTVKEGKAFRIAGGLIINQ